MRGKLRKGSCHCLMRLRPPAVVPEHSVPGVTFRQRLCFATTTAASNASEELTSSACLMQLLLPGRAWWLPRRPALHW